MNYFRCDDCGRFVSYADLDSGTATHKMTLPDSAYTTETYETVCNIRCFPLRRQTTG
jgi:hypothetical protein